MNIIRIIRSFISKKTEYNYYSKEYYYKKLFEHYNNLNEYNKLIRRIDIDKPLLTDFEISLIKDLSFTNITRKLVLRRFGKPYYKHKIKETEFEIELFIYKIFIGKYKTKLETHFFNDTLFYYTFTFSLNLETQKNEIIRIFEKKYSKGNEIDVNNQYIKDKHQSVVIVDNSLELKIHYLNSTSAILSLIHLQEQLKKQRESKSVKKLEKEVYNTL
jgi:hypothetical protein